MRGCWPTLVLAWGLLLGASCAEEAQPPATLIFAVSSDALVGDGPMQGIQLLATDGTTRYPAAGNAGAGYTELSESADPVVAPVYLSVEYGGTQFANPQVEVLLTGVRNGAAVAVWSGTVTLTDKKVVSVRLRAIGVDCDGDADGFPDCSIAGCCAEGAQTDCAPDEATANPWAVEPQCEPCDDVIDQDCDGADRPCVDGDGDGIADCQEVEADCGVGDGTVGPGMEELCDGKDNNCDGQTDEGKVSEEGLSLGEACGLPGTPCQGGFVVCSSDPSISPVCNTASKAEPEVCGNQQDDDCNGIVDDGCIAEDIDGDGFLPGDGEDADCNDYNTAIYPGAAEPCCPFPLSAGEDPDAPSKPVLVECDWDCDGLVSFCTENDEDGDGIEAPADCDDTDPNTYPGAPEKCGDGIDQDCFGGDAACGLQADDDGDGFANDVDCDDVSDAIYPGATELCDGIDNDCDGVIDGGNPGGGGSCGSDVGECTTGIEVCSKSGETVGLICAGNYDGGPEQCDDLDHDCDGTPYNGLELDGSPVGGSCDGIGACGTGSVECTSLKEITCSTNPNGSQPSGVPETCDSVDNDCDGQTDEELGIGDSTCLQQGVCANALADIVAECVAGVWNCDYTAVADYEDGVEVSCDDKDNDCDGFVDDDFGIGLGCDGPDEDLCASGTVVCNTTPGATEPTMCNESGNSAEVCDGLDNDCDGETDEDFTTLGDPCDGPDDDSCENGVIECAPNGSGTVCGIETITNVVEVCDGQDNDCDGGTDENFPSLGQTCDGADSDSCANGTFTCNAAGDDVECTNETTEDIVEICDDVDNDCDGTNNEGADPNLGQPCDGPDTDDCTEGIWECPSSGDLQGLVCSDNTSNLTESCDGTDEDCDGVVDEGLVGGAADGSCSVVGVCGDAVALIVATCVEGGTGTWACDYSAVPDYGVEVCDGLDNDCNGIVDDGFENLDGDSLADCVDDDIDGDGFPNDVGGGTTSPCTGGDTSACQDNCVYTANSDQGDVDGDSTGNACDDDIDGDGILDTADPACVGGATTGCSDNCPFDVNPLQEDTSGNGIGDACTVFNCTPDESSCDPDGRTKITCNSAGTGEDFEVCDFICAGGECVEPTGSDVQALVAGCDATLAAPYPFVSGTAYVSSTDIIWCPTNDCGAESYFDPAIQNSTDESTPVIFCTSSLTIAQAALVQVNPNDPPPGPVIFIVDGDAAVQGQVVFDGFAGAGTLGGAGGPGGYQGGDQPADSQDGPAGEGSGGGEGGEGGGLITQQNGHDAGGGGGGGFGGTGGNGGEGADGAGGLGGTIYGEFTCDPLIGGSGGGAGGDAYGGVDAGPGGGGGGAVQIVARGFIGILSPGYISVRGGGGRSGPGRMGAGGGGSGGAILLEASTFVLDANTLDVRGGNGGTSTSGPGGAGASGGIVIGGLGTSANECCEGGGGGGGGAGRVRINTPAGGEACTPANPAGVCTSGQLPVQ